MNKNRDKRNILNGLKTQQNWADRERWRERTHTHTDSATKGLYRTLAHKNRKKLKVSRRYNNSCTCSACGQKAESFHFSL